MHRIADVPLTQQVLLRVLGRLRLKLGLADIIIFINRGRCAVDVEVETGLGVVRLRILLGWLVPILPNSALHVACGSKATVPLLLDDVGALGPLLGVRPISDRHLVFILVVAGYPPVFVNEDV